METAEDKFYLEAFGNLNTCRNSPGGPIPWWCIVLYADRAGLDDYVAGHFVKTIRSLDGAYLAEIARTKAPDND